MSKVKQDKVEQKNEEATGFKTPMSKVKQVIVTLEEEGATVLFQNSNE